MKVAICDSCLDDMKKLSRIIEGCYFGGSKSVQPILYNSIKQLKEEKYFSKFEYVFLDESVGDFEKTTSVVWDTHNVNHLILTGKTREGAASGYGTKAEAFILKPYDRYKIKAIIEKCERKKQVGIMIRQNGEYYQISHKDITYAESAPDGCIIHTIDKKEHRVHVSLKKMESILGRNFIRCSNYYLVSLSYVDRVGKSIVLTTGESLQVSRKKVPIIKKIILESKNIEPQNVLF